MTTTQEADRAKKYGRRNKPPTLGPQGAVISAIISHVDQCLSVYVYYSVRKVSDLFYH